MIIEVIGEVLMPLFLAEVINGAIKDTLTTGESVWVMVMMILTALMMMLGGMGGAYFGAKASEAISRCFNILVCIGTV